MRRLLLALFVAGVLHPGVARPELRLEGGAMSYGPAVKRVQTLRDLRYANLVRQRFDFSCGSAALGTLLTYFYGIELTEVELIQRMLEGADPEEVVRNGFSMLDMKRFVERDLGLRARGFRVQADALYRLQIPVLALIDTRGYKHFVVVKGASDGRVFVADPALGHRVMPIREFEQGWNNILLAIVGEREPLVDSPLLASSRSLALQHRVDALDRALAPPPLIEFGLVRIDLF